MFDEIDVVVIGGGRAGVTVAYALGALGKRALIDFVVFDAAERPGGSWGASWRELRMRDAGGLVPVPGLAEIGLGRWAAAGERSVRTVLRGEFARFEDAYDLAIVRPARVLRVERRKREPRLAVTVDVAGRRRTVLARSVISATGTRSVPFVPVIPGAGAFAGAIEHSARLDALERYAGRRVLVVGSGAESDALLASLREVGAESHRAVLGAATRRREAGSRAKTLLGLSRSGGRFADGTERSFDAVLLATGRRAALRHLAPLRLREVHRGVVARDGWSHADPRVGFAGDPSAPPSIALERAIDLVELRTDRPPEPERVVR